jgi:NADH:ubiquinone oxidoreductase subunit 6 (subunit J)
MRFFSDQFSLKMLKVLYFVHIMGFVMLTVLFSVIGFSNISFDKENHISQEGISILIMALTVMAFVVSIIVKKKIEKANEDLKGLEYEYKTN